MVVFSAQVRGRGSAEGEEAEFSDWSAPVPAHPGPVARVPLPHGRGHRHLLPARHQQRQLQDIRDHADTAGGGNVSRVSRVTCQLMSVTWRR